MRLIGANRVSNILHCVCISKRLVRCAFCCVPFYFSSRHRRAFLMFLVWISSASLRNERNALKTRLDATIVVKSKFTMRSAASTDFNAAKLKLTNIQAISKKRNDCFSTDQHHRAMGEQSKPNTRDCLDYTIDTQRKKAPQRSTKYSYAHKSIELICMY